MCVAYKSTCRKAELTALSDLKQAPSITALGYDACVVAARAMGGATWSMTFLNVRISASLTSMRAPAVAATVAQQSLRRRFESCWNALLAKSLDAWHLRPLKQASMGQQETIGASHVPVSSSIGI